MTLSRFPDDLVLSTESFFMVALGEINGKKVGTFRECSGLDVEWDVVEYAEGGNNEFVHKLRGRAKYPNLVLKRGITSETALLDWFFSCRDRLEVHDVTVSLCDNTTRVVRSWKFLRAWPVKWQGPTLNAGGAAIASETLEIAHSGFGPVG